MDVELLYRYRAIDNQITDMGDSIAMLRSKMTSIKAQEISDMPKGSPATEDRMADSIAKLLDLQEEWAKLVDESIDLLREIDSALNRMPDVERRILKYKFVHGWTWDSVAAKVGYTERGVRKARKRALRMFAEL